ncbi:MAG: hypothetical protein LUC41_04670, partial [Clostridiales bacterium]|nr:hypothetical protein [Clostridiales bacterium]
MCRGDHTFRKEELVKRFDCIVGKTLGELDDKGLFESAKGVKHQKGIVGDVIEQCVLGYEHDNKQAADLTIIDDGKEIRTELKATGIVQNKSKQFVAKEPMSITAVGVYDIADEEFETSHFWEKLEHMLIVYYHYASKQRVSTYGYRLFPVEGYEFHEHTDQDKETLRKDWECVHNLIIDIVSDYPGEKDDEWKKKVRDEYIKRHGELRQKLSYVDLVPKFPPRFRLKKPVVSTMVSKYFGQDLRELPETYNTISEVDSKCRELTEKHAGKTISQIAADLGIHYDINKSVKSLVEPIIVAMFGGDTKKLNRIEIFGKFGIIAKSIVMTAKGGRTEDTKLYQIDFEEMCRKTYVDEEEGEREYRFEDSDMYSYFADHEFLYVIFEEDVNSGKKKAYTLANNKFKGFKRLVFDEEFIYGPVKKAWEDTRDK